MKTKALQIRYLGGVMMVAVFLFVGMGFCAVTRTQAADVVELKFAFPFPEHDDMWIGAQYMVSELEKRTNGRVKIVPYFSAALGKLPDSLDMVNYSIADIALFPPAIFPKVFRIFEALGIPAWGIPDMAAAQQVVQNLFDEGLFEKDLKGYKLLLFEASDPMGFGFKQKISSLEEIRKLKLRTPPGITGKTLEALGCSTVSVPTTGIYMAIDRGVADGLVTGPGSYFSGKLSEVAPFWLNQPFGTGACITIMSRKRWDKLPDDIKSIWEEINREAMQYYLDQMKQRYPNIAERYQEAGATYYTLSPEEAERWVRETESYAKTWVNETEAKGYPAEKAVQSIKATVRKYMSE